MLEHQQKKSSDNKKLHIALPGATFCFSAGGIFFLSLITKALVTKNKQDYDIKLSLLMPEHLAYTPLRLIRRTLGKLKRFIYKTFKIKYHSFIDGRSLIHDLKKIDPHINIVFYNENKLEKILQKIGVDCLLPNMKPLEKDFPIQWVGGIYDFQYKYYPEFFPIDNSDKRDAEIKKMLTNAKAILVNSHNTKNDIIKFFPTYSTHNVKIFCMPFAAHPEKEWFKNTFYKIEKKYNLPKKYFLIANQLWVHKEHSTAIKALYILNKKHNDIHIVCTGELYDSRFPNYFEELQEKIIALGLKNNFFFLGYIPQDDLIQIMRNSIAVIQPTLFEGGPGGGSAYYAIATDTPIILSDIPVNLEIKDESPNILFFKTKSHMDLVDKMLLTITKNYKSRKKPEELLSDGFKRLEKLGDILLKSIETNNGK